MATDKLSELIVILSIHNMKEKTMGRGILLWLVGVPIPVILLLSLFWH